MNEQQLRQIIKEELLKEQHRFSLIIPNIEKRKAKALLSTANIDFDIGIGKGTSYIFDINKKDQDKVIKILSAKNVRFAWKT